MYDIYRFIKYVDLKREYLFAGLSMYITNKTITDVANTPIRLTDYVYKYYTRPYDIQIPDTAQLTQSLLYNEQTINPDQDYLIMKVKCNYVYTKLFVLLNMIYAV